MPVGDIERKNKMAKGNDIGGGSTFGNGNGMGTGSGTCERKIKIKFSKTVPGKIDIELEGFNGVGCHEEVEKIVRLLAGDDVEIHDKAEKFQSVAELEHVWNK